MIQCRNKSLQGWCVLWFWPLVSDGIVWLSYLAGKASCLHILLSCEMELTLLLIKIPQFARELSYRYALGHFSPRSAMSRNEMAAEKSCQESKGKHEKDVLGVTVATALLNLACTGLYEAGQTASVGIVLPEQLGTPRLVDHCFLTSG